MSTPASAPTPAAPAKAKRLPKSTRIHIRRRKAELRRGIRDPKALQTAIDKLYDGLRRKR